MSAADVSDDLGGIYAPAMESLAGVTAPTVEEFLRISPARRVTPIVRRLLADDVTPVGLYRSLADSRPGTFLLESAETGRVWSRYSFIGVRCPAWLVTEAGVSRWEGKVPAVVETASRGITSLDAIGQVVKNLHSERIPGLPPLTSGLVGAIGYDAVRNWERLPDYNPDVLGLPESIQLLVEDLVVFDHHDGALTLVANVYSGADDSDTDRLRAYESAVARLDAISAAVASGYQGTLTTVDCEVEAECTANTTAADYRAKVEHIKERIRAGDAFQVVVSQRFSVPTAARPLDIYRVLRFTNPSPYMYLVRLPGFDVVGSSPEALVTVHDGRAMLHPIAGTRPRGANPSVDAELADDLLADEKERAEHLMLVDLGRNDLGRVCEPGSVEVVEFMAIERYSHVMHIVSTVVGELAEGRTSYDVLAATFPAGTLSGAPKPMAMAIIEELETSRRGIYAGAIGYFDFAGDMDTAIAIRTAVIKDGVAHVQAGAGIVADSDPVSEDQECHNKAAAVLRAVAIAETLTQVIDD